MKMPAAWQGDAGEIQETHMHSNIRRAPRQKVLILSHPDGCLEIFGEGIDVHLARVPVAFSPAAERQAEEVTGMLLPLRFRDLWRRDRLRAVGTTRPLLPSVLAASLSVPGVLEDIEGIPSRVRNRCKIAREGRAG
jgi:hypothetical protein